MVDNVVLNDAVEDVAADETEFPVHGRGSALDESPVLGLVVGRLRVSVVEVCDSDYNKLASETTVYNERELTDPVVHPKVRQAICEESSRGSNALGGEVNRTHGEGKSNVTQSHERRLRWCENIGSRV